MASNLATIRVELIANAQRFKTEIDKSKKKLKEVGKAGTATSTKMKGLSKIFQNTAGSIAAVQGPLGPVAGRISSIGAIIGRVSPKLLALTAISVGLGLAFTKLVQNTAQVERQMLKLEGVLKATGNAAGLTLEDIEDLSREIGINTLASVREVRDASAIMLTFKSVTGDVFKDAMRLSQDLAELGFGSVKTGATQLGKALEDPITGLGALRRVGVSFTESQKEMIKVLVMTGKKAEAQRIILDALDQQVGKAGVKAAQGLAGAIDSLKENMDIFFENTKLGRATVDFLTASINKLANAMGSLNIDSESLTTIKQVNEQITRYKAELQAINDLTLKQRLMLLAVTKVPVEFRAKEVRKLLEELDKQLGVLTDKKAKAEAAERNKRPNMADISGPITQETILGEIRAKNDRTHKRNTDRALEDLGKTQEELKNLNDLRKIEDELRKKIGSDGEKAEKAIADQMKIATEEILKRNEALAEQTRKQEELNKVAEGTGAIFSDVGQKINDAMVRGKLSSLDFKTILLEAVIALQKMIFKVLVLDEIQRRIEERMKKNRGGGFFEGVVGAIFGGGKAGGGRVQAGTPTMVGERGPELFVPNTGGVVKNNADTKQMVGSGGGISVTQNLNFAVGVTNTVRAEVMNMLPAIQQSTVNAVAEAKQRGGKFSKAFGS